MAVIVLLALSVAAATPQPLPSDDAKLRALVADPAGRLLGDPMTAPGFRIITLSNAAEACAARARSGAWAHDEAQEAITRLAMAARDPRLLPFDDPDGPYGAHNLYLTHWLIVLNALATLDPLHDDVRRAPALARHLARVSLAHDSGIARSFPSSPARWPADQAATLHALVDADHRFGLDLATAPRDRFLRGIVDRPSRVPGLPVSEWTGHRDDHDVPRGTSVSWSIRYLDDVAPDLAASWWTVGRETFLVEALGFSGFREWPEGEERPADIDSGPIVLGMSAAATAFAVGASRTVGDCATYATLSKTQSTVRALLDDPDAAKAFGGSARLRAVRDSALATAIAANQASLPTICK